MTRFLLFCLCLFTLVQLHAQQQEKKSQAAWQQKVNYKLFVQLNDIAHILNGREEIEYTNHSPDMLTVLYFHLWPNAYKSRETAFARQQLEDGKTDFYYAEEEDRGWIDSLNFAINGNQVKWELTDDIDIAKLIPDQPIKPGETIVITTPFRVKIPKVFSRLGHEDQQYCITQWYPKPAVYDVNGWNPMPYLDQGEFYSEFGRFDVSISVPDNYVVAATGNLTNPEEYDWLLKRSTEKFRSDLPCSDQFPLSSSRYKTLRYVQDSIHDFAWFCDKRFKVERSEVTLPQSGRTVTTWFFSACPKGSLVHWMDTAILFYSRMVGEYPYQQATGVYTPLLAGGGMEYPTITNMSSTDRTVIVHEVGHNWFYGILASNERLYPWMDESINNYYELRSTYKNQPLPHSGFTLRNKTQMGAEFSGLNLLHLEYLIHARKNNDQRPTLPSYSFTNQNYGGMVYGKAAIAFLHLQQYLGDEKFDGMMRSYYEKWKFKHPLPNDFIEHAKAYTGEDLGWFFEVILGSERKVDFKIKNKGNNQIAVSTNTAGVPFSISKIKNDTIIETRWYKGFYGKDTVLTYDKTGIDYLRIDALEQTTELYRDNNTLYTRGLLKTWPKTRFRFLANTEDPYANQLFFTPVAGANLYNKTMLGMAFYNSLIPQKRTSFLVVPMYAFGTKDLAGSAEITRSYFLSSTYIKSITPGIKASRYGTSGYFFLPNINYFGQPYEKLETGILVYEKIEPFILIQFRKKNERISDDKNMSLQYDIINEQKHTKAVLTNLKRANTYLTLVYNQVQERKVNPYGFRFSYQYGQNDDNFQKITGEAKYTFSYNQPKKGFFTRVFAGYFIQRPDQLDTRAYFRAGNNTGFNDYLFEQSQFGRGENNPFASSNSLFAQQLLYGDLAFKELVENDLFKSNHWATGANLETTLPGIIPIRVYADFAYLGIETANITSGTVTIEYKFLYTAGISLVVLKDIFRVNFPLTASQDILDAFNGGTTGKGKSYGERISFSLNLNRLNPVKAIRGVSF